MIRREFLLPFLYAAAAAAAANKLPFDGDDDDALISFLTRAFFYFP